MLAILGRADWPATAMTIYRIMAVTCYSVQHDHVFAWIPVNGRNSSFWLTFWCLLWKIIHFLWAQKSPSIPPSTSLSSRPAACISSENNYMNMPSLLNIFSFSEVDCSGVHLALCIAGMSALFLHHLICNTAQLRDMSLQQNLALSCIISLNFFHTFKSNGCLTWINIILLRSYLHNWPLYTTLTREWCFNQQCLWQLKIPAFSLEWWLLCYVWNWRTRKTLKDFSCTND